MLGQPWEGAGVEDRSREVKEYITSSISFFGNSSTVTTTRSVKWAGVV